MGRRWCMWRCLAALLCFRCTEAQIYSFEKMALPDARSLHTLYAFYVYSHQDAPERTLGQPFVQFHNLMFTANNPADSEKAKNYGGIQLSILPYRSFWTLIQPDKFCSSREDVAQGIAKEDGKLLAHKAPGESDESVNLYSHTVTYGSSSDHQVPVHSTGVYILVFSNCGEFKDGEVSGSVIAKNSYGFLPGNEYHKMPFYGWLAIVYIAMAMLWMCLSLRYWRELFHIQYCVAAVIFLGLVEAFLQWRFFMDWNETGVRGRILFVLAILATVVKSIFSYMLVLVASLGWGVTRPYLDQPTILKVQALSFFYIVLDFVRESALSFRHSHSLSIAFVLLCLLPVALLNGHGLSGQPELVAVLKPNTAVQQGMFMANRDHHASPSCSNYGFDDTWSTDGFTDGFTGDVNPDLASHFISLGLAEHASVASFARVVMELMQLAAPADLVDRTLQAGREEVRHAQVAFSLARTWSAEGYQLGPLNGLEYAPVSFVQLARQTVFEAILGETAAFLRASLALRFATHQGVREFLLQVASDERRHAELAWATVAWAVQAKAEVVQEVLVALDAADEELARSKATGKGNLAYGILSSDLESAVHQEAANLVKRFRQELSSGSLLQNNLSSFELRVQQEFDHSISRMAEVKEVSV
ncbi:Transmembrane protein 87A [Durusdinium trenchii]|uniref:Transmembrane protein 87A n=1 Tax=Durusdinium trenchii TaxID=1381693 RepID=A0ABP0LVW6_9DINO